MKPFDVIIAGGLTADGTGERELFKADIGLRDGKIAAIGDLNGQEAEKRIDAAGLLVTPGFIDPHSHGDSTILVKSEGRNPLEQGITTELTGNCGNSSVPFYADTELPKIPPEQQAETAALWDNFDSLFAGLEKNQGLGPNVAMLIGHGAVRARVMDYSDAEPTPAQLDEMRAWVRQGMKNGCYGMSSGLIYAPGVYAKTEELTELARVVAEFDGLYVSHIRNENYGVIDAVAECIEIGEKAGSRVLVSHHKVCGPKNEGLSVQTLKMIEQANERGVYVRADQYPFIACSTGLIVNVHPKHLTEGAAAFAEKLGKDRALRAEVIEELKTDSTEYENILPSCGMSGNLVVGGENAGPYIGKSLAEVGDMMGVDAYEAVCELLIANHGNVSMVYFDVCESDMRRIIAHPFVMAGTDSRHNNVTDTEKVGGGHPRGTSTFVRHLCHVRDHDLMPVHKAIYRVTGLPAQTIGLTDRGYVKEGLAADLCVLDWGKLKDNADFIHPFRRNEGILYVFVNGVIAAVNCVATGALAGHLLRRGKN